MKKKLITLLLASFLVLSCSSPVFADEKDNKIEQLEAQIVEMQKTIDELQKQLDEASAKSQTTSQDFYKIGEPYVVENQWKITVDSVEEVSNRNEFSEKNPAAVYLVTYTYENLGYDDDAMNGLYISLEDGIVDSFGKMGYSYPGDISMYPQETPVGAFCQAQACIGVDNAGDFKINFYTYDSNGQKQSAIFEINV